MRYVSGTISTLPAALLMQLARYRHDVFVRRLGWQLACAPGVELDEFDCPDTVYVIALTPDSRITGTARLLRTTRPYLLEKVFPELWGAAQLPHSEQIWELSRFAALPIEDAGVSDPASSADHTTNVYCAVLNVARQYGASSLVTVSPLAMERLLRVRGFRPKRMGLPTIRDGQALASLQLPCTHVRGSDINTESPRCGHRTAEGP